MWNRFSYINNDQWLKWIINLMKSRGEKENLLATDGITISNEVTFGNVVYLNGNVIKNMLNTSIEEKEKEELNVWNIFCSYKA